MVATLIAGALSHPAQADKPLQLDVDIRQTEEWRHVEEFLGANPVCE